MTCFCFQVVLLLFKLTNINNTNLFKSSVDMLFSDTYKYKNENMN